MLQPVINLIHQHRLDEAATLCEQLARDNKKELEIRLLLADIYQRSGLFVKAENTYQKLIKLKADHALTHTRLAMLYHSQGLFAKALPCYQRSLQLNNNNATVHFNLGVVLQEQGKLDAALTRYRHAIKLQPDYAKAYANLGYVLRQQKKTTEAIEYYRMALELAPDIAEIHYNIGMSLLEIGQTEAAEQHQHQALNLKPDYADAHAGLGAVQLFTGDSEKAINSYQRALSYQPDNVEILCACARALSTQGQHEQATVHIKHALYIRPDSVEAGIALGHIYLSLGNHDEALACCNNALKARPQDEGAIGLSASIHEKKGNAKSAYECLSPLLEQHTQRVDIILCFASISKSLGLVAEAIERMEQLLRNNKNMPVNKQCQVYFALGKAYDSQKDYDRAFNSFKTANQLKQAAFDIETIQNNIDAQIRIFSPLINYRMAKTTIRSNRPIFIIGMPRSGTSLVEQILASHPQIAGAGELPNINDLVFSAQQTYKLKHSYPEYLQEIQPQQLDTMAQAYLDYLSSVDNTTRHVTDKMPGNFMHLGLIQSLFPEARVIHCIRNPLDTCLSCYFQDFSESHPWIYNLQDCGRMYLEYQRLMQHWKNVLNISILDVQYEDLVNNQESISRQMIDFCDLDWDEACLQFHKNRRFIWTASYDQVRQPMYNDSVERWKNYALHIEPLIELFK